MGEDIARKEEQCNEKAETEPHGGVQGEGGLGGVDGRQDAGGAGREVRRARQLDHAVEDAVAGGCDRRVHVAGRERGTEHGPTTKEMQAKIGQLALEVDFLEVALGRVGDASAKR